MQKVVPFLMFTGNAEEAISFYTSLFKNSGITSIVRYGLGEAGTEGSVLHATFTLNGQELMAIDSNVTHGFTFTPAFSLYIRCESEAEVADLFTKLSLDGEVLMSLDRYPFSRMFGWVQDRFGVSWQLNLD
jgi:predicted 3-demethylubiquinone-9 3-methyltransferase (glyoxalase superfamily)